MGKLCDHGRLPIGFSRVGNRQSVGYLHHFGRIRVEVDAKAPTDFHKALGMQNFDLPLVGEDSETDLDCCMFARRLYHNAATSYNLVLGLHPPDQACEELDFCPNTSRTRIEFFRGRVSFSEHTLN